MSENQFLEIIDGKIDVVKNLVEQQTKSGMFFDGFTKQVLEKINDKLDTLSGMETNELITYLAKEVKNSLEERHLIIQERLDGVQGQINAIQNNLVDSLKSPEIAAIFTKLSDTVLDFSRNLNSQTKYFNSTVEDIQKEIAKINVDEKFIAQTNSIRLDIERYKIDVASVVDSINSNFASIKDSIEKNQYTKEFEDLNTDISILQKGLNDIISVVTVIEDKQTDFISSIKDIASSINTEDIKLAVSSVFAEMQALKESVKILVNKSDIEFLNEKISSAISSILELKDYTSFSENEQNNLIKKHFEELNLLISSYISKDESELIKNKLEYIQSKVVSGEENIQTEIRSIIPLFSSLSTVNNIKELAENTAKVVNDLSKQIENKLTENAINYETKINSFNTILTDIHKLLTTIPVQASSDKTDALKGEISIIADYISNVSEKIAENTKLSISDIKDYLTDVSIKLSEKIDSLESFTNFVQDKNSETNNQLEELKDFSQKLITLVSALNIEIGLKNENIKQIIQDSRKQIEEKINILSYNSKDSENKITEELSRQILNIQNLDNNITHIGEISEKAFDASKEITSNIENLEEKIKNLSDIYTEGTNQISENISKQDNSIKELESKVLLCTDSTVENTRIVDNVNTSINKLDEKVNNLSDVYNENTNQVSEVISKQGNFIRELETKVLLCADSTVENIKAVNNINTSINKLDEKVGTLSTTFSTIANQIETTTTNSQDNLVNDIESKIAIVTNSIVEKAQTEIDEKLNIITNTCGLVNSQVDELLSQQENSINGIESKVALVTSSIVEHNKAVEEIASAVNKLDEKLIESDSQRKTAKEDILSKITEVMTSLGEKLSQSFVQRTAAKEEIIESVKGINKDLTTKLDDNTNKIDIFVNDIKQLLGTSFANIIDNVSQENIKNDEFKEKLKIELQKTISEVTNKLIKVDENNENLRAQVLDALEKTINSFNEKYNVQLETINDNFSQLQNGLVKNVVDEINLDDLKVEMSQELAIYAVSLKEKIDETITILENNKDYLSMISTDNSTNIMDRIVEIKNDLSEIKLGNASGMVVAEIRRVGEKIEGWSNDILDSVSDEVKDAFSDNIRLINETVQDNIAIIKDDIQELVIKLSDINAIAQDVKNAVAESFEIYLDNFYAKVEDVAQDIKKYIDLNTEKLTSTIKEYKKEIGNLSDLDLSLYQDETKQFIQEQIDTLKEKIEDLHSIVSSQNLENLNEENSAEQQNEEIKETITTSIESINKRLEVLRDILLSEIPSADLITENFDDVRLTLNEINEKTDEISELKTLINEINKQENNSNQIDNVQSLLNEINDKTNNFVEVVKSENASLKDVIIRYQSELNELSNLDISSNDNETKDFIKNELSQLKEQFVRNLTCVFENISFIEESEEIQNAILDNADVIKNEINQLKQDIIANSNSTYSADQKFEKLKSILEGITTGDVSASEKYIYTLPDVEMDIAKMRMAISEVSDLIKQNREDGYDVVERLNAVDDIREDISSISKRTNKLILTSDDSNKYLRENIEDFKNILNAITKKCNKIDSTQLNQHLVDVKSLVMSGLKSDKILNEAFMHLAEWIDDSAKSMNTISSQVEVNKYTLSAMKTDLEKTETKLQEIDTVKDEISQVKDSISELAFKLDKKSDMDYSKSLYDIEYGLDRISDKLDMQEMKIKALEKKIETLSMPQDSNEETNSLLEFIASQVTAANENSRNNRLLVQKIALLEKQMSRFEASIAKITQFVDGAN